MLISLEYVIINIFNTYYYYSRKVILYTKSVQNDLILNYIMYISLISIIQSIKVN